MVRFYYQHGKAEEIVDRDQIKKKLVEAIAEIQEISGRQVPQVQDEACPIGDIEGFDSVNCVELACELSSSLGFEVDAKDFIPNVLAHPVTIGQAVDRLYKSYETQKKGE
jgi:acyl carrier protein